MAACQTAKEDGMGGETFPPSITACINSFCLTVAAKHNCCGTSATAFVFHLNQTDCGCCACLAQILESFKHFPQAPYLVVGEWGCVSSCFKKM